MFDLDRTSKISFKNLKQIAQDIRLSLNEKELYEIFEMADRDGDGLLDFQEFYRVMKKTEGSLGESLEDQEET